MARKGKGGFGCLPVLLFAVLALLWLGRGEDGPQSLDVEQVDPRGPRRPMPKIFGDQYVIADQGPQRDSQGTAFIIDGDGVWMTAEHVTHGCDRIALAGAGTLDYVSRVAESRESDAALLRDGPPGDALPVAAEAPQPGDPGFHMGFPSGEATLVASSYIGSAQARRGAAGEYEPIYAWAEEFRSPDRGGGLGGISGGPTFSASGAVIGVNSASTERRGRVLTTAPQAMIRLIEASGDVDEAPVPRALVNPRAAIVRFQALLAEGRIRQVYCDVR